MNGIDNIKNKILSEAEAKRKDIEDAGAAVADQKAKEAAEALLKEKSVILEKGAKQAQLAAERIVSSASKELRKKSLAEKQALIDEVFEEAKAEIVKLSGEDYKKLLIRLIRENCDSGKEEVLFSKADSEIAAEVVASTNKKFGGHLTVSNSNAPFEKGVVLREGDVEVNLSLANIAEYMREELTPAVAELLFG